MVTVKMVGAREIGFDMSRISRKLAKDVMPEIVGKAGFEVEGRVKKAVSGPILKIGKSIPGYHIGGTLRKSIHTTLYGKGKKAGATVGSNIIYASVHEFGATIRAKRAKYLKFKIPGIGWRQKKSVTIPARQPFARTFQKSLRKIDRIVEAVLDRILK